MSLSQKIKIKRKRKKKGVRPFFDKPKKNQPKQNKRPNIKDYQPNGLKPIELPFLFVKPMDNLGRGIFGLMGLD